MPKVIKGVEEDLERAQTEFIRMQATKEDKVKKLIELFEQTM